MLIWHISSQIYHRAPLMTVKTSYNNKRHQGHKYIYLLLHSKASSKKGTSNSNSLLKGEPFSAKNTPLKTLMKQSTQRVSFKMIFPANELSFHTEKFQMAGAR